MRTQRIMSLARLKARPVLTLLLPLAVLASCAGTTPSGSARGGLLPCPVEQVLATRCRTCHQSPPVSGAPMPLMTLGDLHAKARTDPHRSVYELVSDRIHDAVRPMPQPPNSPLTPQETQVLDDWIATGAPPGPRCEADAGSPDTADGASLEGGDGMLECVPDLALAPSAPYAMPTELDDQYVCFGVDVPSTQVPVGTSRHVIGLAPRIDNRTIVHHVVLYQSDSAESPIPAPCTPGAALSWRVVFAWAPGGGVLTLPPDVGFPYNASTHWVVQLHYNNIDHLSGQTDKSGFGLCTTAKPVRYDADVMAFGTQDIDVDAQSSRDQTCSVRVPPALAGAHLFSVFPHMHRHGTLISTEVVSADTTVMPLGERAPFHFDEQVWSPIDATLRLGDVVKTRCAWSNKTTTPVHFGPNTDDEMCYSFTAYYPRNAAPGWSWAAPSLGSTCVRSLTMP